MSPLRRRMIEDMQIRNLTPHTQRGYVAQVARFAGHFGRSPDLLGPPEIRTYLLHLARKDASRPVPSSSRSRRSGFSTTPLSNGPGLLRTTSPLAVRQRSFPSC
jgi:Phage integrase, N-terminal SAM-like domain